MVIWNDGEMKWSGRLAVKCIICDAQSEMKNVYGIYFAAEKRDEKKKSTVYILYISWLVEVKYGVTCIEIKWTCWKVWYLYVY